MRLIVVALVMAIVAIVLCHRRGHPVVVDYREDDDGVQPYDPLTFVHLPPGTYASERRGDEPIHWSWTA